MRIALLAAAYFAGGRTGLLFSDAVANIALVWPAAGIAVAMLVRFGWRYWPGVYIGSVAVEWSLGYSWWMSLAMGVTCTLGPLAAAFFLQGIGFQPQFLKRRDGLMLVAAGAGGTVLSAAGGVIALNLIGKVGWDQFGPSVFRWWLGDSAGVVMVAPLLLTWSRGEWRLVRKRGVEFGLVCAATLIGGWFVFFNQPPAGQVWQPLTFLTVPLVVWGALRFRPMGASFVSLLLCFVAVWALSWALGPFSNQSLEEQEFLLWTFIMMTSLTTLLVSSLEAERADDEGRLRQIQASLETAQAQAQLGNWELDVAAGCGWWSKEMFRLFRRDFDSGPPDLSEFMDMVHPDDRADLKESQRRVIETGVADCLHFRTNPARGPVRHFDSAFRRTDASGGGVKLIGTVQDVTERHLTEELKNEHAKVLEMIAQGAPLGETLDRLCRALSSQSEGMFCSILLLDEDGRHLRHGAAPGLPKEYVQAVDGVEIGPAVGCCGSAAYLRETVVAEDMRTDSRWANFQSLVEKYEMRSCWSTPIFDVGRRVLGTFAVYQCAPGRPTARQLRLIESATHSASICISHARASDVLRKSQQRL